MLLQTYIAETCFWQLPSPCIWKIDWTISQRNCQSRSCFWMIWKLTEKEKKKKPVCCNITSMCQYSVKKADKLSNIELELWWHNINTEKSVRDYQVACNPMRDRRPAVAMKSTWANGDTWCLNKTFAYPSPLLPETRKFPLTEIMLRLDMCDWTSLYICIL